MLRLLVRASNTVPRFAARRPNFMTNKRLMSDGMDVRHVDLTSPKTSVPFDTHALVKNLQASGFSLQQSETMCAVLQHIIQSQLEAIQRATVTKAQQVKSKTRYIFEYSSKNIFASGNFLSASACACCCVEEGHGYSRKERIRRSAI